MRTLRRRVPYFITKHNRPNGGATSVYPILLCDSISGTTHLYLLPTYYTRTYMLLHYCMCDPLFKVKCKTEYIIGNVPVHRYDVNSVWL